MSPPFDAEPTKLPECPRDADRRTEAVLEALRSGRLRTMSATPTPDGGYQLVVAVRSQLGSGLAELVIPNITASKLLALFQLYALKENV